MCVFAVIFELILIWGLMKTSRFQCVLEKEYFCSSIPNDFPEGLTSVLFVVTKIGVINSSVFNSPNLKSVTSLALANSGITRIEPEAFYAFHSLTKLSLYQNNLTTVMASWLSKPGHLENLTVSQNVIQEISHHMLSSFSNLTTLNLASNRIHMIAGGSLKNLSKLTFIDLSGNNLSTLTRNVFSGLSSPIMKLGDNPWNCSCELQDFGFFLQELMNTSVLEDASSVVCQSPQALKGIPVWNISDFNCPPILISPSLENDFYKVGLPAMLLCLVLFSFLLLLLLLWKVKQDKKQVQPGKEATVENSHEKLTGHLNRMTERLKSRGLSDEKVQTTVKIDKTQQNRMQKTRAKSASPIMLRTEFQHSSSQHHRPTDGNQEQPKTSCTVINEQACMKNEDCNNVMELWYFNSLQDCNKKAMRSHNANTSTELSIETPKKDHSELLKQSLQDRGISEVCWNDEIKGRGNTENAEPLLYLSVASTTQESPSVPGTDQKVAVSRNVNMRLCSLRRVLTWPYEKCKRDESQNTLNSEDFFKARLCMLTSDPGVPVAVRKTEFKDEQNQYNLHLHTVKEQKAIHDYSSSKPNLKREAKPANKLVSPLKKGAKQIATMENACISVPGKGFRGSETVKKNKNNKDIPSQAGFCNDSLHSPASSDKSGHTSSPCDNTLLENNEYTFIDLLHEVVENRGRWTRQRWKQTHQVRIASHPPMKSK
ncbi:protein FAM188A [Platysternon megacephalum]|uniref:Protein FAM188A n=2 Tax=Platysternon megacephalum TaxID=55544 RepID=A0A4D9EI46_9SAUR|nr:protein FAM188A [Platysternon megacephalum]